MATDFLAASAQEEELFALGRMLYGKTRAVATLLPNKTPAELVEYYYLRKRPALPPPSSAPPWQEEEEVELPREANCTKCGHHRVVARRCYRRHAPRRCAGGASTTPRSCRRATPSREERVVAMRRVRHHAVRGDAERGRRHGAHGVCASCGDVVDQAALRPPVAPHADVPPASALSPRVPW